MAADSDRVRDILRWLERRGTRRNRDGMARYGIRSTKAFGVSVTPLRLLARRIGRDHELAHALWNSGWLEARVLAAFIEEPEQVTSRQMDRWAGAFDNWAVCDGVCLHLFVRTPHAWGKVAGWSRRRSEFVKRAAFALLASLAVHDRTAPDRRFRQSLDLIVTAAADDRNYVKKAVSWALRTIGKRNEALNAASVAVARRLKRSASAGARWVGSDALRELTDAGVRRRIRARRDRRA